MTKLASLIPPPGTSKYELAIVAAREARRLNEWSRRSGENPSRQGDRDWRSSARSADEVPLRLRGNAPQ